MKKLKLLGTIIMICLLCLNGIIARAQNRQIQGVVQDEAGILPGITVKEKGVSANGIATDIDGKFKITLKGTSEILIFSGINYLTKEVSVKGLTTITVNLKTDTKSLQEVVVLGYGTQKQVTLTGAVSSVSGSELRENPSASLQNTLTGKVSGFFSQQRLGQPGADGAAFYIRGVSSYTGNNQPLIIVDDIEFSYDQFSRLDANEVESVTILKDASTTAIYGVKGANGVLLVTTRRGKVGPPSITLRSEYGIEEPTILPTYLDSYNTALLYNQAQQNDYNNLVPAPTTAFVPKFSAADLALFQNGQDPYGHPNVNWKDAIFKKTTNQQRENVDVTGGTEKVQYLVSLGYVNQGGITKDYSANTGVNNNYYYHRYNYRSNLDFKVNNTLKLRMDIFGNIDEVNTPYVGNTGINGGKNDPLYEYSSFLSLSPYAYPIKNPDGSWGYSQNQVNNGYNGNNIIERLTLGGYTRTDNNNMNLNASAIQDLKSITKGLTLKGTLGYTSNYAYGRSETRQNFPSFIYNPTTNAYTPRDPNIYKIDKFGLTYTPGSTVRQVNLQAILNYDRTFGENHFSALALFNRSSLTKYIDATPTVTGTPTGTNPDANYNFIPNNSQGATGRINYDFKQKYLITLSGAYNGSDRFSADKRYGFFPAVSAGWDIAQEDIVKDNVPFINQLKPRVSYGLVGSDQVGTFAYSYLQTYSTNNGSFGAANFGTSSNPTSGIQEGTLPNSEVTWEKSKQLDIGVDYSLFNGKLTGLADYFNYNRYDILTQRGTVSSIFGQTLPPVNLGKTNNRGIELELNYNNKIGKDFSYSIRGTFSYAHNKIVFDDEPALTYAYQLKQGHSIGAVSMGLMYQWTGQYFNNAAQLASTPHLAGAHVGDLIFADVNHDGVVDGNDRGYFAESNLPEKNYGLQFGAKYKGFSFSVLFQAATNFDVAAASEAIRPFTSNLLPIHEQAWTPALGDNAKFPELTVATNVSDIGTNNSTFWNISGNYIRLRTAEIAYALPTNWMNKVHVKGGRIYFNGYNLLTWSRISNLYSLDPEVTPGTDRTNYPPERTFNLGVSLTF